MKKLARLGAYILDNILPITMGLLAGLLVGGVGDRIMIQNRGTVTEALETQTWISAAVSIVAGGLVGWLVGWAYARKAKRDFEDALRAQMQGVAKGPYAAVLGGSIQLLFSLLDPNSSLSKALAHFQKSASPGTPAAPGAPIPPGVAPSLTASSSAGVPASSGPSASVAGPAHIAPSVPQAPKGTGQS